MADGIETGFKWRGDEFIKRVKSGATKNLTAAGTILLRAVKADLGKSGGYARIAKSERKSTSKDDMFTRHGTTPSSPGEAPHYRTRAIKQGMFKKLAKSGLSIRVGTKAPEGPLEEFGTRKQPARPYLRSNLNKNKSALASALGQPINTGT